jgi:hypothetical protein
MRRPLSVVALVAGSLFVFNAAALPKAAFGEASWQAGGSGATGRQITANPLPGTTIVNISGTRALAGARPSLLQSVLSQAAGGSNSTVLPVRIQMINLAREKGK